MKIEDMPEFRDKKQVMSFEASTTVAEAIESMARKNYGAVLVTEKDKLKGIFTERDVLRRIAAENIDTKKTKLRDVMTKTVHTAKRGDHVADCLRRMSQGRFRHMPVVDENGDILGMLSQGDFVAFTMSDIAERLRSAAVANVDAGRSTPWTMLAAIVVYTIGLLFLISGMVHWGGEF